MSELSLTRGLRCLAFSAAIACGGQKTASPEDSGGAPSSGASALGGNPTVLGTGGKRASGGTLGGTTPSGGVAGSVSTSTGGTNLTSVVSTTDECAVLAADYAALAQQVQGCNPALSSMQCRALHPIGLVCACEVVVNLEQHADAVKQLDDIAHAWRQLSCSTGAQCGACVRVSPVTTGGGCSLEGTCISLIEL